MLPSRIIAAVLVCATAASARAQEPTPQEEVDESEEAQVGPVRAATVELSEAVTVIGHHPCLETVALVARVRSWLRRDRVDGALRIEVSGLSFEVIQDGEFVAVRRFEETERDCEDVRSMMSLAVALAIDATILERFGMEPAAGLGASGTVDVATVRESGSGQEETEASSALPVPADVPGTELWLRVGGLATIDAVDGLGGGAHLGLEVHFGIASVRAGIAGTIPVDVQVGEGQASTALIFGRIDGCLHSETQPAVGGCLGLGLGPALASGDGYAESHTAEMWWAAGLARVEARVRLAEAWALEFSVEAAVPFVRPELTVHDVEGNVVATRPLPVASGTVGAALVVRLW